MTKEEFLRIKAARKHNLVEWEFVWPLVEEVENAHPEWRERSVTLRRTDWVKLSDAWNYYNNPPFSSVQDAALNRISTALREAKR